MGLSPMASTTMHHQELASGWKTKPRPPAPATPLADIRSDDGGDSTSSVRTADSWSLNELEDDAFIESIKRELCSQWKIKHLTKAKEVASAGRVALPAGFLEPISPEFLRPTVDQDEEVPPQRRRRLLLEVEDSDDSSSDSDGHSSSPCGGALPAGFLEAISLEFGQPTVEQNEEVVPVRRRRLLLEADDSSSDSDGYSSPPCRDFFTDYPKRRRSKQNVSSWKAAALPSEKGEISNICSQNGYSPQSRRKSFGWGWKSINLPLTAEDLSKDRSHGDDCPCCGDSLQQFESKRPKIMEISGHALRKERESAAANGDGGHGSTRSLGLKDVGDSYKELETAERTRKRIGFGVHPKIPNKGNLESAVRTCKRNGNKENPESAANSNKKNSESAERTCKRNGFAANSNKQNSESAARTCKRIGANSNKENLASSERCKRIGLGTITLLTLQRDNCEKLEMKLKEAEQENVGLVNMMEEERRRSEQEKEGLRRKLADASNTIDELLRKIRMLEGMRLPTVF